MSAARHPPATGDAPTMNNSQSRGNCVSKQRFARNRDRCEQPHQPRYSPSGTSDNRLVRFM